jgi:hypothetical protein
LQRQQEQQIQQQRLKYPVIPKDVSNRLWNFVKDDTENPPTFTVKRLIRTIVTERRKNNQEMIDFLNRAGMEECRKMSDFTSGNTVCGTPFSLLIGKVGIILGKNYGRGRWDNLIRAINSDDDYKVDF